MRVTIRLFARLRDIVGSSELEHEVPAPATVADVWRRLVGSHPDLAAYANSLSCAVNEEYVRWDAALSDGDEVAFLPPVSGGEPRDAADGCVRPLARRNRRLRVCQS
ncbi:MAG: molybdopterin converting factor subunit 1 [Vicinamibacterales bacterium]